MLLPRLRPPTILNSAQDTRDLMWTIPKPYAERLVELLRQEAGIDSKISEVDAEESMVSANYSKTRSNFVIFACLVFTSQYNNCRVVANSYHRSVTAEALPEPEEYCEDYEDHFPYEIG